MAKSKLKKKKNTYLYLERPSRRFGFLKAALIVLTLALAGVAGLLGYVYYQVYSEAQTRIERGVIERIIFSESPVFYDDGVTPIGVFFEKTHRQYIEYKDIPKTFVKAIIAAEDHEFLDHPGFDIQAIARAFIANIKAGGVVQGGSTITQQTAKNIFKRERRSYTTKLKELFQALVLEQEFSKEEILELYANQFFVSGFGRGLQIASRYFFDKDARDLNLVECAFIAGSVKGPNRYNPFIKKTEAERSLAVQAADQRKEYVLKKMLELNFITQAQYSEAAAQSVPFREGQVTYGLNSILDYVRDQLQTPFFKEILAEQGIENIATSGIRIHTAISRHIQEGALRSLRNRLPSLEVLLRGYDLSALQERYRALRDTLPGRSDSLPFFGRVTHVNKEPESPSLVVSWEEGGGVIDLEGLKDIGEAWVQSRKGIWARFEPESISGFMDLFNEGDLVALRFAREDEKKSGGRLVLTHVPELEGGVVVLQNGMVRGMVGGYFNRHFNRAVDARRQLGSTFKPIVYAAALQLKWNALDALRNAREVYQFENTSYIPNPDHEPTAEQVSMAWAGVKSENLATVWLLYHLTDHLSLGEFREVAGNLGLDRHRNEPYQEYVTRIRDGHGVLVDREALMEAAFYDAKKNIESDVIFGGYEAALQNLRSMRYHVDKSAVDLIEPRELRIYRLNYSRLKDLNSLMAQEMESLRKAVSEGPWAIPESALNHFHMFRDATGRPHLAYFMDFPGEKPAQFHPITPADLRENPELLRSGGVWVDGLIPSEVLGLIQRNMVRTYKELIAKNRYDMDVLHKIRDFRVLVNLHYVRELAHRMGISTPLDPVLSFPLGANAVSIAEMARAYSTLMCGRVKTLGDDGLSAFMIPIITRIEDREGEPVWEYGQESHEVLSRRVNLVVSEILRLVVEKGTGKAADGAVKVRLPLSDKEVALKVPAYGKTGTANRYTNSSFVGFIPGPDPQSGELDLDAGYVTAAYVGYDDNLPMKGKTVTLYGSSGALPVWIDTANAIVNNPGFAGEARIADLVFESRKAVGFEQAKLRPVHVSPRTGLHFGPRDEELTIIFSDVDMEEGALRLRRIFEPVKGAL